MKTKAYVENVKNVFADMYLRSLDLYGNQALSSSLVLTMSSKEDFKDFEAMTEKNKVFHAVNLSHSQVNRKLSGGSLQRFYFD